jgi:hypothetical protein
MDTATAIARDIAALSRREVRHKLATGLKTPRKAKS